MNTTTRTERFYFSAGPDLAPIPTGKVPADVLAAVEAFFNDTAKPIAGWTNCHFTEYRHADADYNVLTFNHSHIAGLTNCLYFGKNAVKIMVVGGRMDDLDTAV
jgi:hypothetical protein